MRALAIALLRDEHGINYDSWHILCEMLSCQGDCQDIIDAVEATEGRFYLPKDFAGIVPEDCPF